VIARFETEPPLGTRILLDDQVYELIEAEPYIRKTDGQPTRLLHWGTACPETGCGHPMRVTSGLMVAELQRRCAAHRLITKPVNGKRCRRVQIRIELP